MFEVSPHLAQEAQNSGISADFFSQSFSAKGKAALPELKVPSHVACTTQLEGSLPQLFRNGNINAVLWQRVLPCAPELLLQIAQGNQFVVEDYLSDEKSFRRDLTNGLEASGVVISPTQRSALLDDMYTIAKAVKDATDNPVKFKLTNRITPVPQWHIDRNCLIAITTYQGPGTEFVPNSAVSLRRDGGAIVTDGNKIYQAPNEGVLFFRSTFSPDGEGAVPACIGLAHRSPGACSNRLVFHAAAMLASFQR